MPTREWLETAVPQLVADVVLYETQDGGKKIPAQPGWGCVCSVLKDLSEGWDGWPLLKEQLVPGESRRIGFVFLSGEQAATIFRNAGRFYLWEGRFVGEAVVVS